MTDGVDALKSIETALQILMGFAKDIDSQIRNWAKGDMGDLTCLNNIAQSVIDLNNEMTTI